MDYEKGQLIDLTLLKELQESVWRALT